MLYYDKMDASEFIDFGRSIKSILFILIIIFTQRV